MLTAVRNLGLTSKEHRGTKAELNEDREANRPETKSSDFPFLFHQQLHHIGSGMSTSLVGTLNPRKATLEVEETGMMKVMKSNEGLRLHPCGSVQSHICVFMM